MSSERPTVSVVVPTMGDPLLEDALDSIAAQSYDAVETVVVDGSGDESVRALGDRIDVYEYQEPRGLSAARNRGIDLASGEYIAFLDEDDLFTPESVALRVRELERGCDVVYGDWFEVGPEFRIDAAGAVDPAARRPAPPLGDQERQFVRQFVHQGLRPSAVMANADCFDAHRFDPQRRIAEDFHLWVRLMHDFRVGVVDEPVLYYRVTEDSLSRADRDAYREEKLAAIDDLVARYPELEAHAGGVKAREWYLHAREKLAAGDERSARSAAARSLSFDLQLRAAALYLVTHLPRGLGDKAFSLAERAATGGG